MQDYLTNKKTIFMSNTLPQTSLDAYKALQPEHLRKMYTRIVEALKVLGTANYEQLADYLQCREPNQISRRLKEMEGLELIWKPGAKSLTKRNRQAYVYQLREQPKTEAELTLKSTNEYKNQKSASDFANNIIKQAELF